MFKGSENKEEHDKIETKKPENKINKNEEITINKIIKPEMKNTNKIKNLNRVKEIKEACNKNQNLTSEPENKTKNENTNEKSTLKRSGDGKEIKVKVKGKVTDIQTLKDFLARAKAERAERGMAKNSNNANSAEGRTQPSEINQRESSTIGRENLSGANLQKIGTRNLTAKGNQPDMRQL